MKPYTDTKIDKNTFIRTFKPDVESEELVWHRDKKDRNVFIMENSGGWMLQMDNELPKELKVNTTYFIPKETYHRVWRGNNNLIVEIKEN